MEKFTVAVAQMRTVSNKQVNYEKAEALIGLCPFGAISYENGKPVKVETIVVSHQHTPDMPQEWLEEQVR